MKLGLMLASVVLLSACTVKGVETTADGGARSSPPADAPADAPASAGTVPPELAGKTWSWVTSSGGNVLAFTPDGKYTSDVLVDGHPGESCGTEYVTHYAGDVSFTADTFTMRSTVATRKKSDTCKDQVLSEASIEPQDLTRKWRMQDGDLLVTDESGYEATYRPE